MQKEPNIYEIVSKAAEGENTFRIWLDVNAISRDRLRDMVSKAMPGMCMVICDFIDKLDFPQAFLGGDKAACFLDTLGDLCLKHKAMTVKCARECVRSLLSLRKTGVFIPVLGPSAQIRFDLSFGICLAKLAARQKFSDDYEPVDEKAEAELVEKLREL